MKRKIAVITGTRAEYGLLRSTMEAIRRSPRLALQVIVTGTHLSPKFGNTYRQIIADGFRIDRKVDLRLSGDSPMDIAASMGAGLAGFAKAYVAMSPDVVLVLGDRSEILAAVSAAIPFNIPVAHIAGGEITQGAMDEQIRHAITKIAHIHFPCARIYADNVRAMGEESWRVHTVGHPRYESLRNLRYLTNAELCTTLGLDPSTGIMLATLHPTTLLDRREAEREAKIFFDVLEDYVDMNIVVTYPNSDKNNALIIRRIRKLARQRNVRVFKNLGDLKYLSLMKACSAVVGNSSSGLVDTPFLGIPCVDYGDRQQGRRAAANILHAPANAGRLKKAIDTALYDRIFVAKAKKADSVYGKKLASRVITAVLERVELGEDLIRKRFVRPGR